MFSRRHAAAAFVAAMLMLTSTGCVKLVSGTTAAPLGPSVGAQPAPPGAIAPPPRTVVLPPPGTAGRPPSGTAVLPLDQLVSSAVRSVIQFWKAQGIDVYAQASPVTGTLTCGDPRWSPGGSAVACEGSAFPVIRYQVAEMQSRREHGGDVAVRLIIAHEIGHVVQRYKGFVLPRQDQVRAELAADCAAGAFLANDHVTREAAARAASATEIAWVNPGSTLSPEQRTSAFLVGFDGTAGPPVACFTR